MQQEPVSRTEWFNIIGAAVLIVGAIAAAVAIWWFGFHSTSGSSTRAMGEAFADSLDTVRLCVGSDSSPSCGDAFATIYSICLDVEYGFESRDFPNANMGKFEKYCDRWEIIGEMPAYLARAELVELRQAIEDDIE